MIKAASTDANGRFVLSPIPKGSYHLSASSIGYDKMQIFIDNVLQDIHSLPIVLNEKIEELEEIAVSATNVINKFDRQIHFPTDFEKSNSAGGIELIDKMSLSGIIVSKSDNSITGLLGGSVQLRVNGAPATAIDVQAIDPKRVTRVEYHDMPSMRYEGAEAVIDLYVKNRESGGSFKLFTFNALQTEWGTGSANLKINHRKSEFALWGWYQRSNFKEGYSTRKETLNFEDGAVSRTSEGIPARSHETTYNGGVSYSYLDPGNVLFLAKMSYNYFNFPVRISKSRIYSSDLPDAYIHKLDSSTYRDRKPAFNLYFQKKGKNKQFFAFDIVASYFDTSTSDWYLESQDNNSITDIFSEVSGSKYSVIAEAIYEKGLGKGKIGAGVKQSMNFIDNSYKGSEDYESNMDQYITDAYVEWSANANAFNYGISGGGKLQQNIQQGTNRSTLMYKSTLRLGYEFSRKAQLRYQGGVSVETPPPGNLNTVRQEEDGYRIRSGNPDLKAATSYNNMLNFSYNRNSFSSTLGVNYIFVVDPMLKNTFREDDKFISQIQNGKDAHKVYVTGHFRYSPFKRRLNMYARGGYRFMQNRTEDYSHSLNNWYVNTGISGTYKHFTLYGDINTRMNMLTGERILYREQSASVGMDYQWKQLKVGGVMYWSLGSYSSRVVELNRYLSSSSYRYMPETQAWFKVKLSWSFNFGIQHDSGYKRIENSDEDNGLLK